MYLLLGHNRTSSLRRLCKGFHLRGGRRHYIAHPRLHRPKPLRAANFQSTMRERLRMRGIEACTRERVRRYAIFTSDRSAASRALSFDRHHSPFSLCDYTLMPSFKPFGTATNTLRARLNPSLRTRGGGSDRWTSPGHEDRLKSFTFNRSPPRGQLCKWKDWELPCYLASFLTIFILGVGLSAMPDLTIETWAHQKALERLELEESQRAETD